MAARKVDTRTETETRRAPSVVEGTLTEKQASELEDAIAACTVDPRVWTGAFATNVWGGRFAVDGVLGEGAQGTTFSAKDLKTGAKVAVKVFDVGRAKDWKALELFDREVATLKALDHPGIPQLIDVIADDDTGARALVRTLIPGDSLAEVVKRDGPLREAALWSVLVDAADVLGALHGKSSPIVHRDLKPSNLIRRPDGKVCLVDFGGVGRMREAAGSTVVGTFGYMAPEQLYGAQTPATDMYSLGATLLALATGKEPEELPRDGLKLDVDKAAPTLSPALRALLSKLLAPDPKGRPEDAQHLLGELKTIAGQKNLRGPDAAAVDTDDDDARFDFDPFRAHNDGADVFVGIVSLFFGVLGVAGAVVVGQLILPLVLTILAALQNNPADKARMLAARARVQRAAASARNSFQGAAERGARKLEEAGERDQGRRMLDRKRRRLDKKRRREEQRAMKQALQQEWKREAQRIKEQARARARRHDAFWK